MNIIRKTPIFVRKLLEKITALLELFLFLRLLLKFLAANPLTPIVKYVYQYSGLLIEPFQYIFPDLYWKGKLVEVSTVSAMIGYGIAAYLIARLLILLSKD